MDQTSIIRDLAGWLTANPWHPSLTVVYDLCSYGVRGESRRGALYMGEKALGLGRPAQVTQADILVRREDTRTVELVVEVDFRKRKNGDLGAPCPKVFTGLLLASAAADCHTPSNKYLDPRYELRETIIVVVTAYATVKLLQYGREFAAELFRRFHVAERGVRELCVCGGATQEDIETSFQDLVRSRFLTSADLSRDDRIYTLD